MTTLRNWYAKSPVIFNAVVVALVAIANELLNRYVNGFPQIDTEWVLTVLGIPAVGVTYATVTPALPEKKKATKKNGK